jgi:hypothetical protein
MTTNKNNSDVIHLFLKQQEKYPLADLQRLLGLCVNFEKNCVQLNCTEEKSIPLEQEINKDKQKVFFAMR